MDPRICGRCRGTGIYYWGTVVNGIPSHSGTCFRCGGSGDEPTPKVGQVGTFEAVYAMFEKAAPKLKFPKLTVTLPSGRSLKLARAGANSKAPGIVNLTDGRPFGMNTWYGRIERDGTWIKGQVSPEVEQAVAAIAQDPEGYIGANGRLAGHCCASAGFP